MRDPKVGSFTIDPAAPIAGGFSGYGFAFLSVGAQYFGGVQARLRVASGLTLAGACATHTALTHNAMKQMNQRKGFMAKFNASMFLLDLPWTHSNLLSEACQHSGRRMAQRICKELRHRVSR